MKAHPVAGLARINLTFRRLDPQTAARAPACKCGQKAVLKVWPLLSWSCMQHNCLTVCASRAQDSLLRQALNGWPLNHRDRLLHYYIHCVWT